MMMMLRFWLQLLAFLALSTTHAQTVSNDECQTATVITELPFSATGDTSAATADFTGVPDDQLRNLTCGMSAQARGVWYELTGPNDMLVKATLYDAPSTDTKFNIALFRHATTTGSSGNPCDDKECMLSRQYSLENVRIEPIATWFAQAGMTYYVHVAGINDQEQGEFVLEIEQLSMPNRLTNDHCDAPQTIAVDGDTVSVDTSGAFPHLLNVPFCSLHSDSRGAFYSFAGTGQPMSATLVSMDETSSMVVDDNLHLELAVLMVPSDGTCGNAQCVSMSEFLTAEDVPHTIQFATRADQSYLLVVSGETFSDVGSFQVQVSSSIAEGSDYGGAAIGSTIVPPPSMMDGEDEGVANMALSATSSGASSLGEICVWMLAAWTAAVWIM